MSKQTFTISAHKWHSPSYKSWFEYVYYDKALNIVETPKFGELEITVGFEYSDPNEIREYVNPISWRSKDDFYLTYCLRGYIAPDSKLNSTRK